MNKFMLSLMEMGLSWYYGTKIFLTKFLHLGHERLLYMNVYDTFRVYVLADDDIIAYEQWLDEKTVVPLIGICELSPEQDIAFRKKYWPHGTEGRTIPVYEHVTKKYSPSASVPTYVIATNTAFFTVLTPQEQDALGAHEIAHITNGDMDTYDRDTLDVAKEAMADFQVVHQGKGMHLVSALTKIKDSIPNQPWRMKAIRVLDFRIRQMLRHTIPQYEDMLQATNDIKEFIEQESV